MSRLFPAQSIHKLMSKKKSSGDKGNRHIFTRFSNAISSAAGKPVTFILACGAVVVWAILGPIFGFSDTWQLVINTGTTIVTFLMVFLIQNTQNRDSVALQVKLDELIRSIDKARNKMMDLELMDEKELEKIRDEFVAIAKKD